MALPGEGGNVLEVGTLSEPGKRGRHIGRVHYDANDRYFQFAGLVHHVPHIGEILVLSFHSRAGFSQQRIRVTEIIPAPAGSHPVYHFEFAQ